MRANVIRFSLRVRILVYALTLGAGAVILVSEFTELWIKREYWEEKLKRLQLEALQLAQETKAAFHEVRFKLLRAELSRDARDRAIFESSARDLAQWLDDQAAAATLRETKDILRQIIVEFRRYYARSETFLDNLPPVEEVRPIAELVAQLEKESERLLTVDHRLGVVQQEAFRSLVGRARQDIEEFETTLYFSLILLVLCLIALAVVVYRDLIAPLQRQVIASQAILERQEKLGALGLMAAGLAHEIRNPLNSMKARLFTQRRVLGESSPGLEDNRFIDEEIDRLEGIIQEALQFGRPNPPSPQRVDANELLTALGELVGAGFKKSNIQIRLDLEPRLAVWGDPAQIKQALLNLVRNAAESIGQNGDITLRARRVPSFGDGRRRRRGVALEVIDTGSGIASKARKRMFDPFFTTKPNGTGLGLSITAQLVYAQEGQIECQSTPGQGALFAIVLPDADYHESDKHPAH